MYHKVGVQLEDDSLSIRSSPNAVTYVQSISVLGQLSVHSVLCVHSRQILKRSTIIIL